MLSQGQVKHLQIQALELYYVGDSLPEIARKLSLSTNKIKRWHYREDWSKKRRTYFLKLEASRELKVIEMSGQAGDMVIMASYKAIRYAAQKLDKAIADDDDAGVSKYICLIRDSQLLNRLASPSFDTEQGQRVAKAIREARRLAAAESVKKEGGG